MSSQRRQFLRAPSTSGREGPTILVGWRIAHPCRCVTSLWSLVLLEGKGGFWGWLCLSPYVRLSFPKARRPPPLSQPRSPWGLVQRDSSPLRTGHQGSHPCRECGGSGGYFQRWMEKFSKIWGWKWLFQSTGPSLPFPKRVVTSLLLPAGHQAQSKSEGQGEAAVGVLGWGWGFFLLLYLVFSHSYSPAAEASAHLLPTLPSSAR